MSAYLGIDIGSRAVKVVLVNGKGRVLARDLAPAGLDGAAVAAGLVDRACRAAGVSRAAVGRVVATGYGRVRFAGADAELSEITCHARGARALVPGARTVIDVGGQDSKVIGLHRGGRVADFAMNDRCAAGTGRFLEVMAGALGLAVEELGAMHARAESPVAVSSTCTVFAESEVISHLAHGAPPADIVAGLHAAIASRVLGLAGRVGLEPVVVCTGGVAHNAGFVAALGAAAGMPIVVATGAQFAGALGAALLALVDSQQGR
jgi:predicted CoA-substrate-specific enzyme activase